MPKREPVVLPVPPQHREKDEKSGCEGEVGSGLPDRAPMARAARKVRDDLRDDRRHRIFTEQTQAERGPGERPLRLGVALKGPMRREEREDPEEDQRRVGRHEDGAGRGQGHDAQEERGVKADMVGSGEPACEPEREDRCAGRQQNRGEPDEEFGVAAQAGGEGDKIGHHGPLAVVPPIQPLGPRPVVRFVRCQVKVPRADKPEVKRNEDADEQPE